MKYLPIFVVEVVIDGREVSFKLSGALQEFMREKCEAGDLRMIEVLPHPSELMKRNLPSDMRPKAPDGSRYCGCGKSLLWRGDECENCGDKRMRGGIPYSKIRQKFPHMRTLE